MKRECLEAGYRAFNGHVFTADDAQRYNRIQERINAFMAAGMPCEGLEIESAKTFKEIIGEV